MTRRLAFWLALVACGAVAAVLGHRVGRAVVGVPGRAPFAVVQPGDRHAGTGEPWLEVPLPEATFERPDGSPVTLASHRGEIILLNFWGSWCPPCLVEIPHLVRVQNRLQRWGGTIIGPAVDSGSGEDVLRFAREQGVNYPVWLASFDVSVGVFGAPGYPYTLLIDRNGIIRRRYLGPQTEATLLRDVEALVADPPPPPVRRLPSG